MDISVVIPAFEEAESIGQVVADALEVADEVYVVDDGSQDETARLAQAAGATVLVQSHQGYVQALKRGIQIAKGVIIVTLDADGEHDPFQIPDLIAPLLEGEADVSLGKREYIPCISERLIGVLVRLRVPIHDHGTGFRALTRDIAVELDLKGKCTCGTLVMEAASRGARIVEVPIDVQHVKKRRRRKWIHGIQIIYVLYYLLKTM